jgi:membrane protein implicated in regulation of membrane protease activity
MHHLILLLPILGIVVFWLFPLNIAIPVYIAILIISGLMYWAIIRAIRKIPRRSPSFVGDKARVVSRLGPKDEAQYMVEVHGELWSANSYDVLNVGDMVTITSVKGIVFSVHRDHIPEGQPSPGTKQL